MIDENMNFRLESASQVGNDSTGPETAQDSAASGLNGAGNGSDKAIMPRRKRGAQAGNLNGFKHGYHSLEAKDLKRLHGPGARVKAEILASLQSDLGGAENLSAQQKIICQFVAYDVAVLDQINKAVGKILKLKPVIRDNPSALAKLDSFSRPIMASAAANLAKLGFERVAGEKSISEQIAEIAEEQEPVKARTAEEMIAEVRAARGEAGANGSDEVKADD
jgi:hypothetical protein